MSGWPHATSSRSRRAIPIRRCLHGTRSARSPRSILTGTDADGPSVRRHARLQAARRGAAGTAGTPRNHGDAGRDHHHDRLAAGAGSVRARVSRRRRRRARGASRLHGRDDVVLERPGAPRRRAAGRGRHRHRRPRPRAAARARRGPASRLRLRGAEFPEPDRPADDARAARGAARLGRGARRADRRGRPLRRVVLRRRGDRRGNAADQGGRPRGPSRLSEQFLEDRGARIPRRVDRGGGAARRAFRDRETVGGLVHQRHRSAVHLRDLAPRMCSRAGLGSCAAPTSGSEPCSSRRFAASSTVT